MQHSPSRRRLLTAAGGVPAASWLPSAALAQSPALPDKTLRPSAQFASLIHDDLAQWKDTIGRLHISIR